MSIQDSTRLAMAKGQALIVFVFAFGLLIGSLVGINLSRQKAVSSLATASTQRCEAGDVVPAP